MGAFFVILCSILFVLFVPQIFIAFWFSFILESCKNRSIKLDFTSAYTASESSFLSKSDSILWPAMDSAEAERLSEVLRTQEARLNRQEEFQTAMAANMGQLSSQIQELLGQLCRQSPATLTPPSPAIPEVPASSGGASCKLAPPTKYAGEPGLCRTFLIDCSIHFELMPQAFLTE